MTVLYNLLPWYVHCCAQRAQVDPVPVCITATLKDRPQGRRCRGERRHWSRRPEISWVVIAAVHYRSQCRQAITDNPIKYPKARDSLSWECQWSEVTPRGRGWGAGGFTGLELRLCVFFYVGINQ